MSTHERERLSAWLDGELAPPERAEVEAHLAACEDCAALLAQLAAVDETARSLPAEAPEGYFDRLPSRVRARIGATGRAPRRLPLWTWAAAAALLLALVTPLTLRQLRAPDRGMPGGGPDFAAPAPPIGAAAPPAAPLPGGPAATPAPRAAPLETKGTAANALADKASRRDAPAATATSEAELRQEEEPPMAFAAAPAAPAAPAETQARAENGAGKREVDEGAGGDLAAAAPQDALQESARERMQRPAMAPPAPATGAVAGRSGEAVRAPIRKESRVSESERDFRRLDAVRARTAEEWRQLREDWRSFAASCPDVLRADEARVRTIEAGFEAWTTGGTTEDEAVFRRDQDAYLERADAPQKERVRRLR